MHHGGIGTTHNAARAGKPQMIVPLMIYQFYWGKRSHVLGLGPGTVNVKRISNIRLEAKVRDLMANTHYKKNALNIGEKLHMEDGVRNIIEFIEDVI
jgi:UDP:flavonoid glycosyltransferase YjiC (YdhE family)